MAEGILERILDALNRNSALIDRLIGAASTAGPSSEQPDPVATQMSEDEVVAIVRGRSGSRKDARVEPEEAPTRRRTSKHDASAAAQSPSGKDIKVLRAEFQAALDDFLRDTSDDEYENRLVAVVDPVLKEAGVEEPRDLDPLFWPKVILSIQAYLSKQTDQTRRRR